MKTDMVKEPPSAPDAEDVRQALDRILCSKYFVNAHKKKKFLQRICDFYLEGRAHELNEYILGYDVFGRDKSYNPSHDPIVRVFAHEIRKKLEIYYINEGAADPIRLEIPAGNYQPVFSRQIVEPEAAAIAESPLPALPEAEAETSRRSVTIGMIAMGIAIFCLAVALLLQVLSNRQMRQKVSEAETAKDPATYGQMWATFLKDDNPPLVILSNPPVLRFTNPSDPEAVIKDSIPLAPGAAKSLEDKFVTNPEVSIKESGGVGNDMAASRNGEAAIVERNHAPRLILSTNAYTGMGEAIGLFYLTDFFSKAGRNVLLKQSRTLSAEDLKKHNVILLGGVWVNEWSSKLTKGEDFAFTSKGTIENRNLQTGEEPEYIPQFDRRTGSLLVDYALITVKPGISDSNEIMSLAGVYSQGTEAAAEYITNRSYLEQLNQRLEQVLDSGEPPRYFQALIKVGVENGIPTTISILAMHELRVP
ncbi:MAG TPA: hypothetical protein VNH22_03025 [Blastocatellia bacterium]|jgi:hypothetical protein|nr:hypothetical protein [Blastocatellia bacterium]